MGTVTSGGLFDAIRGRLWRSSADLRRRVRRQGSAASALASLGHPSRQNMTQWIEATERGHADYRSAHEIQRGRVAVICVSMRPEQVGALAANVARQDHPDLELIFVANAPGFDAARVAQEFDPLSESHVIVPPVGTSLGAGLNLAMAATDARFIAKFDDDDHYGRAYLSDAMRAHGFAGSGVVGKHTYYVDLVRSNAIRLRFPGHEFSYSGTLAGGTLVIDRDRVGDQGFDDVSIGEDRAFISACHRRGVSTFSADRFNFTQCRTGTNTWDRPDDEFVAESLAVGDRAEIER